MTPSAHKKVIIIGASSGIGRELAILYANAGWRMGITGRREALLDELKDTFPDQVETAVFDVMGTDNIRHLEQLIQKLGGLDLLVYNAGYGEVSATLDWSIDKTTVLTNVNGFIKMINFTFNYF